MAWVLQLEDHRMLRETLPAPPPDPKQKKATPAPTPQVIDLAVLVKDDQARMTRGRNIRTSVMSLRPSSRSPPGSRNRNRKNRATAGAMAA